MHFTLIGTLEHPARASEARVRLRNISNINVSDVIFQLLYILAIFIILIVQVALCISFSEYVSITTFTTLLVFMGFHCYWYALVANKLYIFSHPLHYKMLVFTSERSKQVLKEKSYINVANAQFLSMSLYMHIIYLKKKSLLRKFQGGNCPPCPPAAYGLD